MSGERNTNRALGNFTIFFGLTIITLGIYPMYFWVSRLKQQNTPLGQILAQARRGGDG
ncbi:MAG: DUF4234 domain-containing protein [Gammaproteobacteria bacterium]|nr:DUF4234 domain-containing protein [Gammaproteobacteria bacterium]MYK84524.1 DUF4234 domain-containing protein [Gammaproteobacteria bacterium]